MSSVITTRRSDAFFFIASVALAILCGFLASQPSNPVALVVIGMIVGSFLLILPTHLMVWMTMFFIFFIQGTIQYYGKTGAATWMAFGASALILVKMIATVSGRTISGKNTIKQSKTITAWLVAYLAAFSISLAINLPPLGQSISAFKNALPALGLLLAIGWGNWPPGTITQLWWLIVASAVFQLPPVVHQHFFVAASRLDQGWDSVVGTMGGNQEGGGLNAMLALLAIVAHVFVLARYKRGLFRIAPLIFISILSLAILILGEVKAVFVWLPIALLMLYWRTMIRNPVWAIATFAGFAILFSLFFAAYQALYWEKQNLEGKTFSERVETIGGYFFDAKQMNYQTGEVSRAASIALWINDSKSTPVTQVFGYGPGASKSVSVLGQGEVAYRYAPLGIDSTTIATLLWDLGLLGLLCYSAFIITPFFVASRLLKSNSYSPAAQAEIETARISLLLMSSLLIYNRTLVDQIVTQALLYLAIGTIVFHARRDTLKATMTVMPSK